MAEKSRARLLAGVGVAVILVASVAAFWAVDVCEDQLSSSGDAPVQTCRPLALTDPPVVALGLALLGLVGVFYNEVSGFGITLKRAVQGAKDSADRAREQAAKTADEMSLLQRTVVNEITSVRQELTASQAQTQTSAATAINQFVFAPGSVPQPMTAGVPAAESASAWLSPLREQAAYRQAGISAALDLLRARVQRPVKVAAIGGVADERLTALPGMSGQLERYVARGASSTASIAVANSAVGHVLAMAPSGLVLSVGVVDERGMVLDLETLRDGLVAALSWEPDVVLFGVAGGPGQQVIHTLLNRASQTAFVVAGAGNDGAEAAAWPGNLPGVASIAALDPSGRVAPFSNRGSGVDMAAPGVDVLSLTGVNAAGEPVMGRLSGTSLAEQLVGGIGAMLVARAGVSPAKVLATLTATATTSPTGPPAVDALAATGAAAVL